MDAETQRILLIKQGLVQMCSTPGWAYFQGMSKNVIAQAIQEALDEDDPVRAESKRLKAKAMQKGLAELFGAVEIAKSFDLQTDEMGNGFELDPFALAHMDKQIDF